MVARSSVSLVFLFPLSRLVYQVSSIVRERERERERERACPFYIYRPNSRAFLFGRGETKEGIPNETRDWEDPSFHRGKYDSQITSPNNEILLSARCGFGLGSSFESDVFLHSSADLFPFAREFRRKGSSFLSSFFFFWSFLSPFEKMNFSTVILLLDSIRGGKRTRERERERERKFPDENMSTLETLGTLYLILGQLATYLPTYICTSTNFVHHNSRQRRLIAVPFTAAHLSRVYTWT